MLTIANVRKSYGRAVAVDDLSLELRPGEIFGLLGPNGAGKSTLVNLACGLLRPDAGRIELAGLGSPDNSRVRARIGLAPQELALYEELSAATNLAVFGRLFNLAGARLRQRCDAALEFVGLSDRRRSEPRTMSGGMKRRLNLALAIVHDPDLLLLDEPTVGVDPQSRNAILENVRELRRQGRTIVYTTHYMEEAQRVCDRIGIVDHGRLLALGSVDELIARHGGRTVVTIEDADGEHRVETDDPLAEIGRLQLARGLRNFRVQRPDLERVFLNLTGHRLRD